MTAQNIGKYILCVALGIILAGCAQEMDTSFQKLKADPKVKLFQVFDETPAIKSMFDNIDQNEMNTKMNDLQNSNPELMAQMFLSLGNSMYGDNAPLPQMVKSMAEGLDSFHEVYSQDPDSLDATFDIADDVLRIDPSVMMRGTDALINTLTKLRNWNDANNNKTVDPGETPADAAYQWDFFGPYQEMDDMGYTGINRLIDNLDFVHDLYDGAQNLDDISYLAQNLLQTVVDDNIDVEASVADVIDYIENPDPGESIQEIEEDVADWMIADPVKSQVMDYLVSDLYPMMENPVLAGVVVPDLDDPKLGLPSYITTPDDYQNFVKRGRWLLDEQMKIFAATPVGLSQDPARVAVDSTDTTLLTQWIVDAFSQDIQIWDNLETVNVFDFSTNNEMLHWLADDTPDSFYSIGEILKKSLKLGSDNGIDKNELKAILWDGWNYTPTSGTYQTDIDGDGAAPDSNFSYKGILYVHPTDPNQHGYVAKMANTRSSSNTTSPFRAQINDMVNGDNDGNYRDPNDSGNSDAGDPNPAPTIINVPQVFKKFHLNYGNVGGDGTGESQLESMLTNIQLYMLSQYYCTKDQSDEGENDKGTIINKWANTHDEGKDYFGDSNRCLQNFLGGITTAMRNMVILNEDGVDPRKLPGTPTDDKKMSMFTQFLYLMAGGYGVIDPSTGPGELTIGNCLRSMGSVLADQDYLSVDTDLFPITVNCLGMNDVYRRSSLDNGSASNNVGDGTWFQYATQADAPANEYLQPGTFRTRTGGRTNTPQVVGPWHGKFAPSQGDLIGVAGNGGQIITANWILSEIALVCWEGYGPFTYKGRAPNGSDCRYKGDYYSDWYAIQSDWFDAYPDGERNTANALVGPGSDGSGSDGFALHGGGSRYHLYEAIDRPASGTGGNVATDLEGNPYKNSLGVSMPKNGYLRNDGSNYLVGDSGRPVLLDCSTREEAIRKNFKWLMNQKRYQYIIPIHGSSYVNKTIIGFGIRVWTEIFAYSSINCNGIVGISKTRRFQHQGNINDNAVWPGAGAINAASGDEVRTNNTGMQIRAYDDNCTLATVTDANEPDSSTFRFREVSFKPQDFTVVLDYTYDYEIAVVLFGFNIPLPESIEDLLIASMISMTEQLWGSLGNGTVLPGIQGTNFTAMITMGDSEYLPEDVVSNLVAHNTDPDIVDFQVFYDTYFPGTNMIARYQLPVGDPQKLRADELPAVPRVNGVMYPDTFDPATGEVATWKLHNDSSKGKFEDFLSVFAMMVGTMHEDGVRGTDINEAGDAVADIAGRVTTLAQINSDALDFYARDGFRSQLDSLVLTMCALNQSKVDSANSPAPLFASNIANILVDHDPSTDTTVCGSRKGLLPTLVTSKYANLNDTKPIKESAEKMIRHMIRTYMNSFLLSKGPLDGSDIQDYYLKDVDGEYITDALGNRVINPDINWDIPINKLRFFTDNRSLDQLKRTLDLVKDMSHDATFVNFLKKSIPAVNSYLYIKWLEENWDGTGARPTVAIAEAQGLLQLNIEDEDIDDIVELLNDFEYAGFIEFIQEYGLNDIEKIYNFTFDSLGEDITPTVLKEKLGDFNEMLVKYFGLNLLEGAIEGIYEIVTTNPAEIPDGFATGDIIYGLGNYVEYDETVDGDNDKTLELTDTNEDGYITGAEYGEDGIQAYPIVVHKGKYLKYVEALTATLDSWVEANRDDETKCKVVFPGLRKFIDFRSDATTEFAETCLDYTTQWYRAGQVQCPNIFNMNNYDLRMDFLMDEFNEIILDFTVEDFKHTQPLMTVTLGKDESIVYQRPMYQASADEKRYRFIDWLYGYNGSTFDGLDVQKELGFWKNMAVDAVFDDAELKISTSLADNLEYGVGDFFDPLVDPTNPAYQVLDPESGEMVFNEKYSTTSVRKLVQMGRTFLNNELIEYVYGNDPDPDARYETGEQYETYHTVTSGLDMADGHRHAVNNITEAMAVLLSPVSRTNPSEVNTNYVTGDLFTALEDFIEAADIEPEQLLQVRKAVGYLLWDEEGVKPASDTRNLSHLNPGYYTQLFTKMSEHAPDVMRQFQGLYADMVQVGLLAFADDGIGAYMMDVMQTAEQYDSWDLVEEFNYLINTDIFQNYMDRDTFWWQAGNLVEDLAIILLRREERGESSGTVDYFGAVSSIFR